MKFVLYSEIPRQVDELRKTTPNWNEAIDTRFYIETLFPYTFLRDILMSIGGKIKRPKKLSIGSKSIYGSAVDIGSSEELQHVIERAQKINNTQLKMEPADEDYVQSYFGVM